MDPTPYAECPESLLIELATRGSPGTSRPSSLAAVSRPDMSRTRADYSGIPCESEVTDCMADKDCEEDVTVVVHSK